MKIRIRFGYGPQVGTGHFRRCLSLAEFLVTKGCKVELSCLDSASPPVIPPEFATPIESTWVIFDTHLPIAGEVEMEKKKGRRVLALDNFHPDDRDVSINVYNHSEPISPRVYSGYQYVILRPDLPKTPPSPASTEPPLICIGGADTNGQSSEIAQELLKAGETPIVVLGSLAKDLPASTGVEVLRSPPDFLSRVASARFVVCNGGNTLFEAVYLRKKCWVVPQTQYEATIANDLYKKGQIAGWGVPIQTRAILDFPDFNPLLDIEGPRRIHEILCQPGAGGTA